MKLKISTAFYDIKAYAPYVECLVDTVKELTKRGIEVEYYTHCGDSYVDRAKNAIITNFMESDCDELLMIDSDLLWNRSGILKLLSHDVDFVAGVFPMKNKWAEYPIKPFCDLNNQV